MITILSRIIHYGIKNFVRNGLLSTATVAIVTLSALVFAGLLLMNASTDGIVSFLKDKIDVSVYFKEDVAEDEILRVKSAIEGLVEVKSVEYISADRALAIFKERHASDPDVIQSIEEIGKNPLLASLNVKAYDPEKYRQIASFLESEDLRENIDEVSYAENQQTIDNLVALVANVNRIGLVITIVLSLIAGLVVFNTIRIMIYSNRDEIGIMRVVGASNALVRGPYMVEGAIIGSIASAISLGVILLVLATLPLIAPSSASSVDFSVPGFSMSQFFYQNIGWLFIAQLLFGVGLTSASSFVAVRRYLKH